MAAAKLSLGETIKEDVTCTICLELITRPKMLPCQHTFCQDCLQVLAAKEGTFQCPYCRLPVRLPAEGVLGLPDNRLIASLCEKLQNQVLSTRETREEGNRCSFHPSQELHLFCKPCHLPICTQCLEEAHDSHFTTSIKKAAKDRRPIIQDAIKVGRNILETNFNSNFSKQINALNKEKQQTDKSINLAYEEMVQKLAQRRDHLLSEVKEIHSKNMNRIQNGRVLRKELSDACDLAEQEMEHGGIRLLRQENILTKVVRKYQGKAAPSPIQPQPAVFQQKDTPVPILGHVTSQSLPHANIPATPTSRDMYQFVRHIYQRTKSFGIQGQGPKIGEFNNPRGIAVSEEGTIFVADHKNRRIQVITIHQDDKWTGRQFPTVLSDGQKMAPYDIAMDREENLWVVGGVKSTEVAVQYNKQGNWVLRMIELQHTGQIRGIAVDTRRNHILITQTTGDGDKKHGEVQVFTPDGTLVRTVGAIGQGNLRQQVETGDEHQGMKFPQYVAVDGEGNIVVSDNGNSCIYMFNAYGKFMLKFGGEKSGEGQLQDPKGICIDTSGNIIVADKKKRQSELFDKRGVPVLHITVSDEVPQAVAVTKQGHLVVTDCVNHKVVMFGKKGCQ